MSCLADEVEKCDFCLIRSQRADVVGVMMYEDIYVDVHKFVISS